jgi:hypothetical protein
MTVAMSGEMSSEMSGEMSGEMTVAAVEEYDEYMDDTDIPEDIEMLETMFDEPEQRKAEQPNSFQLDLDALLMYYQKFFPSKELCQWLSFGNGIK